VDTAESEALNLRKIRAYLGREKPPQTSQMP
jgi:hypothetical protein